SILHNPVLTNNLMAPIVIRQAFAAIHQTEVKYANDEPKAPKNSQENLDETRPIIPQKPWEGVDCPICFESMENDGQTAIEWCKYQCGNSFHADCLQIWFHARPTFSEKSCPCCRIEWEL